tara:strand:- start:732 stop:1637 length:906 start_codon:yes stop_codon:yes gene_type:complete
VHYSDPNYLNQGEFSSYDEISALNVNTENEKAYTDTIKSDSNLIINNYYGNYYEADDYYDFSYSSRIRRFHRPFWSVGYYGGMYTNYYWYNQNPYYFGSSIYYGYNWNSPYYSYYSYSPFYSYYHPYYHGHYHNYYGMHYHNHHHWNSVYSNSYDNNSYTFGHRGSLSAKSANNKIKMKTNYSTINRIDNKKRETVKIRSKNTIKESSSFLENGNAKESKPEFKNRSYKYNSKDNNKLKNNRSNDKNSYKSSWNKNNSNNKSNSYQSSPKNNNRNFKSNSSNSRKSNQNSYFKGKRGKPKK